MKNLISKYARLLLLCFVSAVLIIPKTAFASQVPTGAFSDLPKKNVISDNETFDMFTSNKNNVQNITLSSADYQLPIKFSRSGESSNISVNSVTGASGEAGDYGVQLCYPQKSSLNGTYIAFYMNGKDGSTSAIKNDRIIFEMDILLSQSDAAVQLRKFLGDSVNHSLFNTDGTVGSNKISSYHANEWKHLLIDMNFPGKYITIYYDNTIVDEIELTVSQIKAGTGVVQFNLINNNTDTAGLAIDNLNIYTIATLSETIGYSADSMEYDAINNSIIPNTADKLILPLTGTFKDAKNVVANVSLTKDDTPVDGANVSYTTTTDSETKFTYGLIKITLPSGITAGDYTIKYGTGLVMMQTIGSTTTEIPIPTSYEQPIKIVETDKISLGKASDGAYNAEVYYNSSSSGSATLIIAAYKVSNDKAELSSLNYEDFDLTVGLNKLTLTHSDSFADFAKAMLWSDVVVPILPAVTT